MSLTSAYKYQYDETGKAVGNLVTETRTLAASDPSVFVPLEGLYFGKSLVVTKAGTPLVKGTDYELEALDMFYTETLGQAIYGGIKIKTANMLNGIQIQYQCLGGAQGQGTSLIKDLIAAINNAGSNPSVNFGDIIGFPPAIAPGEHKHYPSELHDMDLLAQEFRLMMEALTNVRFYPDSNHSLHNEIFRLTKMVGSLRHTINGISAITGFASDFQRLEDIIENYETKIAGSGTVNNGTSSEMVSVPLADFQVLDFILMLKNTDGSGMQTLNFSVINDGTNVGVTLMSSHSLGDRIIHDHTSQFTISDSGDKFTISHTAAKSLTYAVKIIARF